MSLHRSEGASQQTVLGWDSVEEEDQIDGVYPSPYQAQGRRQCRLLWLPLALTMGMYVNFSSKLGHRSGASGWPVLPTLAAQFETVSSHDQ